MTTKERKKAITNQKILDKLDYAGVYTMRQDLSIEDPDSYSTIFSSQSVYNKDFDEFVKLHGYASIYDYKKQGKIIPARTVTEYTYNYMIPIDIYRQYVSPRFKGEFSVGDMVRIRQKTKRAFSTRNKHNQAIGDSQDFSHLGIGSGKQYFSEDQKDLIAQATQHLSAWQINRSGVINNRIKIGNYNYCPNIMSAIIQTNSLQKRGKRKPKERHSWMSDLNFVPNDFYQYVSIKKDGIFGPKTLINGYVTNVYVHFLYPKWERKREARYEILLETGAKGIWTNDYINKVYDTDYSEEDSLLDGCKYQHCNMKLNCDHTNVHLHIPGECDTPCLVSGNKCSYIYDYRNFMDTTHGTALEIEKEEKNAN